MNLRLLPLLLTATAFAAEPAMQPSPDKPEALPKQAISALEVQPEKVVIDGIFESAQVIVTAKLATGETADVTRLSSLKLTGDIAAVTPAGHVTPLKNGATQIDAEVAGKRVTIPVEVRGIVDVPKVDFIREVNPVMTKTGCNAGTCHGAKDGKVGFKLSLRGYDPLFDIRALKDDLAGRRLNAAQPDDSLMLLKATGGVPHEGGQRVQVGDKYYNILRTWIADGAKVDMNTPRVTKIDVFPRNPVVLDLGAKQQFRIVATYADGKVRDVTAEAFIESGNTDVAAVVPDANGLAVTLRRGEAPLLARYEGSYAATTLTVMGDRTGFVWKQPETWSRIDELVAAKWQRMKIEPSGLATDEAFLRRAYLDLTGLPPSSDQVRAFVADQTPTRQKRDAVVDKLIGSPEFVEYWTNKWADMLQVNSKFLGAEGAKGFRDWIRSQVEKNTPYDQFVRSILTATGSNKENPAGSYWKILREPAETLENTTHLFLATRFNCNKCHDHPFERWTQDQYYQLGAYFAQVGFDRDPASGKAVIVGSAVEKAKPLYEIVKDTGTGELKHDRTGKPSSPSFPYLAKATLDEKSPRRAQLAEWMTSADNRYFASSYANRLWGYLTGAGVIEPLDDIRAGNPPSNPELLDYLTQEFVKSGFNARHVLALIAKSRTYQLSVATNKWNEDDKINYSHALARRLPAEVLYDSVLKVTGSASRAAGGQRAQMLADGQSDLPSGFLANLGKPPRESSCECERSSDLRLGSVMALLSGPAVADAVGDAKNSLTKLVTDQTDDAKLVDEIFMRVLNRAPKEPEVKKTLEIWGVIESEHKALIAAHEAKEQEQAPIITKMEAERVAAIETAKKELARYETEIAPKVAEAEKKRQASIVASDKAVKDYEKTKLAAAQTKFEQTVPVSRTYTGWQLLDPTALNATNQATLVKQPDGSIKAGPNSPRTSDYVITVDTKLAGITGFLLEVLPDAEAPNFGPGRASGNFVLGEFALKAGVGKANPTDEISFVNALADYSQERFDVKGAIDGKKGDQNNGWAVGRAEGQPHWAAFQLAKPLGNDKEGMRLRIELNQPRAAGFYIARFRIWVTTSAQPLNQGLPLAVSEALKKPGPLRSKEDNSAIARFWNESDPDLRKMRLTLGKNQLPLPTDPGVIERRAVVEKAELPIRLDPKLVQLRADVEQSKLQNTNRRLTGAQDLVWALVNTPAFLFNH